MDNDPLRIPVFSDLESHAAFIAESVRKTGAIEHLRRLHGENRWIDYESTIKLPGDPEVLVRAKLKIVGDDLLIDGLSAVRA